MTTSRPINILVAALGGQGGGVLSDWLIAAARAAGLPIQSTSVPGVAQRTGATTYYLEIFPEKVPASAPTRPVLALTPTPGDIDIVVASELVEAGRAMQNGFVSPDRTTLIASTTRVFTISERGAMADGRFDVNRISAAAGELARTAILFDMEEAARSAGCPVSAVMFGALVALDTLPIRREVAEDAIRQGGKAVEANLKGFAAGHDITQGSTETHEKDSAAPSSANDVQDVITHFDPALHGLAGHGVRRLIDYQDAAYARLYLDRLRQIAELEERLHPGSRMAVSQAVARYLALWMSYEDVIRVADLKIRGTRATRIREEVRAREGDIIHVTEYLKPGLDEICSVLPPRLATSVHRFAVKRGLEDRLNIGLHIRSTAVGGFIMLRLLAALRPLRRRTSRFADEGQAIERWLGAVRRALAHDVSLAREIAACGQIVKGYGDTHRRAMHSFNMIAAAYFDEVPDTVAVKGDLSGAVHRARAAALSDPEGGALERQIAVDTGRARPIPPDTSAARKRVANTQDAAVNTGESG